jgi:hypothetical protein
LLAWDGAGIILPGCKANIVSRIAELLGNPFTLRRGTHNYECPRHEGPILTSCRGGQLALRGMDGSRQSLDHTGKHTAVNRMRVRGEPALTLASDGAQFRKPE